MLTHEKVAAMRKRIESAYMLGPVGLYIDLKHLLDEVEDQLIEQHAKLSEIQKMTRMYNNDGDTPCQEPDEGPNW